MDWDIDCSKYAKNMPLKVSTLLYERELLYASLDKQEEDIKEAIGQIIESKEKIFTKRHDITFDFMDSLRIIINIPNGINFNELIKFIGEIGVNYEDMIIGITMNKEIVLRIAPPEIKED